MLLTIKNLTKTFVGMKALDDVSFELEAGEVHALLGENGAGKSTLIKCLTGAYSRDSGVITLNGGTISPRSTLEAQELGIGTVYQEVNLLPNLTVAQNLVFGREQRRFGIIDGRAMRRDAEAMLEGYGLDIDVNRDLGSYSVAVQQIVAIARAVALSGKVLILDEPFGALDAFTREDLWLTMHRLREEEPFTGVLITHDLREAIFLADEVIVLSGRPATVQYSQSLPQRGPRSLDHLYTPEATDMLNILREQIRIARKGEEPAA